ncbi:DMT family transporter [Albimonas sp. CAU 1670]|uniref:DMT family transporter n=1 Tax=Albimonas sp. CAU 1670 TaxID=3032599 RepID=UPI0023D99ACF|nr:DMT family transporter [Albimonas sp. CAU 1670]MDF2234663.1 DMT family transporter [Albimonas sp. CAU 1670]
MTDARMTPIGSPAAGALLMCVGVASLSVNDAIAKTLTATYSPLQILFLRNAIALPFAIALAWATGGAGALRSHRPAAHVVRGALWIVATLLFFTSISRMGLAEATALAFVAPLFITALSALLLAEPVGWRRWLAVLAGFVGVLIVVRPGAETFRPVSLLPVATAFVYAFLMIGARWLDPRESVWTLLLYLTGAAALLSGMVVPFVWIPLRAQDLWLFGAIAVFGTAGMTMMTQAFRLAPAAVVAPLDYTALIWATLLGWLIWREIPDAPAVLGAAVIVASGGFVLWREHRLRG